MGHAPKAEFIGRFHAFASINAANAPAAPPGRNTVMPWLAFSGMTDEDLGAIYDYLKTLPPVKKKINTFPDAKGGCGVRRPRRRCRRAPAWPAASRRPVHFCIDKIVGAT